MGLNKDQIKGDVDEDLLCGICQGVLEDALETPCQHAFCRVCITDWLARKNTCPLDNQQVHLSDLGPLHRFIRNQLAKLEVRWDADDIIIWSFTSMFVCTFRCKNYHNGCEFACAIELLPAHEIHCTYMYKDNGGGSQTVSVYVRYVEWYSL